MMCYAVAMNDWPALDVARDHETFAILHSAAQMLGKIRVANAPWENHGWHVALQPSPRGLATLPTKASHDRTFTLSIDLCRHVILLAISDGSSAELSLDAGSISALHQQLIALLDRHGLPSSFSPSPSEIVGPIEFSADVKRRDYDPSAAACLRKAFAAMLPTFAKFRAGFCGKASPVHFWWGAFDLAVSRFSGRPAPPHPGGMPGLPDRIVREAYSHEVASVGFWAGGMTIAEPFFYGYVYPEPPDFCMARVNHGRYDEAYHEFVLPYAEVIRFADPAAKIGQFFESVYAAGANLAGWDRSALEREPVAP